MSVIKWRIFTVSIERFDDVSWIMRRKSSAWENVAFFTADQQHQWPGTWSFNLQCSLYSLYDVFPYILYIIHVLKLPLHLIPIGLYVITMIYSTTSISGNEKLSCHWVMVSCQYHWAPMPHELNYRKHTSIFISTTNRWLNPRLQYLVR